MGDLISLYSLKGSGALRCLDPEAAPDVRMYSLRMHLRTSSSIYHQRFLQWMILCLLLSWKQIELFCSRKCGVILDRLRASYLHLALDDIEDIIDGEPWGEVLLRSKAQSEYE